MTNTVTSAWQNEESFERTNLRMLQEGKLCDVAFLVGRDRKEEIKAHKFMLASRSLVFYAMFCGPLAESSDTVEIPDIEPEIFQELSRFIYTENCTINEHNVMYLLYSAKKYEIKRLSEKCRQYLDSRISVDNVCFMFQHAHTFDEHELEEKCLQFILENGEDVLESDSFTSLSKEVLQHIIKSNNLNADELHIYSACKKWAIRQCRKHSDKQELLAADLRSKLDDVVYSIRFPTMSMETFAKHVSKDHILTPEETVNVFQSIAEGSSEDLKYPFCSENRDGIPRNRIKVTRCSLNKEGVWYYGEFPDVINFRTSQQAKFVGVSLFSPSTEGTLGGKLSLQRDNLTLASKTDLAIVFEQSKYSEEVLFDNPPLVEPEKDYTIYADLRGPATYQGYNGQEKVSSADLRGPAMYQCYNGQEKVSTDFDVSFLSNENSTNGTTVTSGQIYSLIFDV